VVDCGHLSGDDRRKLTTLLDAQLRTVLWSNCVDGEIKVNVEGTLNSGVMNTSLYGVLITFFLVFSFADERFAKFDILCAGDDTNLFVEAENAEFAITHIQQHAKQLGFKLKIEEVAMELEEMTFCRMRPVYNGSFWRMVRSPVDAISRDMLTTKKLHNKLDYDTLRGSIADCGMAIAGDLPVFGEFYRMLGRDCGKRREDKDRSMSGMKYMALGLESQVGPVTQASRFSFWKAFGITPQLQVSIESEYAKLSPSFTNHCDNRYLHRFFTNTTFS